MELDVVEAGELLLLEAEEERVDLTAVDGTGTAGVGCGARWVGTGRVGPEGGIEGPNVGVGTACGGRVLDEGMEGGAVGAVGRGSGTAGVKTGAATGGTFCSSSW